MFNRFLGGGGILNLRESVEIYSMMCVILMMFQFVENWFSMAEVEMFRFIRNYILIEEWHLHLIFILIDFLFFFSRGKNFVCETMRLI